jgi:hypothetical protein
MPDTSEIAPLKITCAGGLVLDRTPDSMPPGAALTLQNFEPNINGGYRRMDGYTPYSSTALTGTGKVLGIAIMGATVIGCRGANVEYGTGTTWTSITTARTGADHYHFDKYNWAGTEKLIMADHGAANYAATWDGSTYTLMNGAIGSGSGTAPTAPHECHDFKYHMFYTQGNLLTWSAPYDENNFTPADGAGEVNIKDTITGLKTFRDAMFIFCRNSIHKLTGSSVEDFKIEPVSRNVGCVSSESIQEIGGNVVFLAHDGLRTIAGTDRIGDVELGTISKPIHVRLKGIREDTGDIYSMIVRKKNQYRLFFAKTSDSEVVSPGVIATLTRQTDPQVAGNVGWEFSDITGIKPSYCTSDYIDTTTELILHGGYSDGIIYKQESGNTFNGTAINAIYRTPDYNFGDVGLRKNTQRFILTATYEGTVNATVKFVYDFGSDAVPQPAAYTVASPVSLPVYGVASYGSAIYGGQPTALTRLSGEGSGFTIALRFEHNASEAPFVIKDFQIEVTPGGRR